MSKKEFGYTLLFFLLSGGAVLSFWMAGHDPIARQTDTFSQIYAWCYVVKGVSLAMCAGIAYFWADRASKEKDGS